MKTQVLGVDAPTQTCTDKKCPFHGELDVKKELFTGVIIKKDINHSATIEWFVSHYVQKYERYALKRSRLRVHNPACINADIGYEVLVAKTRPLSKTKHHVILKVLGKKEKITGTEVKVNEAAGRYAVKEEDGEEGSDGKSNVKAKHKTNK
jgi:small subunit ribosomal protein S17